MRRTGVAAQAARNAPRTPSDVLPACTAARAYSICSSLPDGLKVVREKLYELSDMVCC